MHPNRTTKRVRISRVLTAGDLMLSAARLSDACKVRSVKRQKGRSAWDRPFTSSRGRLTSANSHAVADCRAEGDQACCRGNRHDRRYLDRLLPPRHCHLRNVGRKGGHDLRLHVSRRYQMPTTLGLLLDAPPQIDLAGRVRVHGHRLWSFAIEPLVDHVGRRSRRPRTAERNFTVAERLRLLRGSARALAPSVAAAVACVQVI